MKIIVEPGDVGHLTPGTYEFDAVQVRQQFEADVAFPFIPGRLRTVGPTRQRFELHGYMRPVRDPSACRMCSSSHGHARDCAAGIAEQLLGQGVGAHVQCDNPDGPCACGAWHDSKVVGRQWHQRTTEEKRQQFMEAYGVKPDKLMKALPDAVHDRLFPPCTLQPRNRPKCDECGGSGLWENPANGARTPCSRGCKI